MTAMELRRAVMEDVDAVLELFGHARVFLREQGVNQWQDGYPNRAVVERDIACGACYVLEDAGALMAAATLLFEREPTYDTIYDGAWESPEDSAVVHRVATETSGRGRGVATRLLAELEAVCRARGARGIRVDTHRDNLPMQGLLHKCGFARRGVIYLMDGAERIAFDKRLASDG